MTEKELCERIKAAVADADLADTDIPAIDLYLDQILSLVADKNATSAPRYRERALTKTMINNYSKDGLISPITGKKYSRSHIVEMLLVYALKNTLSIDEIKRVLTGVREECGFAGEDMIRAYHQFLSLKEKNRTRAGEIVQTMLGEDALGVEGDYEFFLSLLDILSVSAYLKEIGRELLESRYKDLAVREQEIREREEQEKQEKGAVKQERKEAKGAVKREKKAMKVQGKAERKIAKLKAES
jgi:DNA-binding transcriptional MerR regulator